MFSTFQTLDYRIFKNIQANLCRFIRDNKQGPLNKCANLSLKYIEPNGKSNDLKMASFLVFFKMSLFKIQSAFLARHHG